MTARKSPSERQRKASGANIEDWQRRTVPILLRLSPLAAQAIREGAERSGKTLSAYVADLAIADIPEAD